MRRQLKSGGEPRGLWRLWSHNAGNIALITALVIVPLTFALGMAFDFTQAQSRQDKLDGIADAAALGAVTPTEMGQQFSQASLQAKTMFLGQAAQVSGVIAVVPDTSCCGDTVAGATVTRNITVKYTAQSQNVFAALLGMPTMTIQGHSSAQSAANPNIDFYMLLDTSPSMEIAATTGDIATMVSNTQTQGGCAFGCHESNPAADNLGNPGGEDNYALARNLGVTLRIDLVNQATQNLMGTARTTASDTGAMYRASINTIDYAPNSLYPINYSVTENQSTAATELTAAQGAAAGIASVEVYDNNCLTQSNCNDDEDSYLDLGLSTANTAMPNPGGGTNNNGDTPQEVLFIVSDGVVDQASANGSCGSSSRLCTAINTQASWCQTIKARGIRIAFLYTTYNPLPTNQFYNNNVAPFQSQIAADAQNCASPGLFFEVNTGGDINAAMQALFEKVVSTARLTQ